MTPFVRDEKEHLTLVRESLAKVTETPLTTIQDCKVLDAIDLPTVFKRVAEGESRNSQKYPYHLVQEAAITGPNSLRALLLPQESRLTYQISGSSSKWLSVESSSPPYLQRFAAHFAILLRRVRIVEAGSAEDHRCDELVRFYVRHLVNHRYLDMVALYCKHIREREMRVEAYVDFMRDVKDGQERRTCLQRAHEYFTKDVVAEITKRTVVQIRMKDGAGDVKSSRLQKQMMPSHSLQSPGLLNTPTQPQEVHTAVPHSIFPPEQPIEMVSTALKFLINTPSEGSLVGTLSAGDAEKIRGIDWLCISEEDPSLKAEAVAQANELLREFFIGPAFFEREGEVLKPSSGPMAREEWRYHAADFLMSSSEYLSKDTRPFAFPTQVLKRMKACISNTASNMSVQRSALQWARVLKEQQCWRVFMKALDSFANWKKAFDTKCLPPPERRAPVHDANQEEMLLRKRRAEEQYVKETHRWLNDCLEDQSKVGMEHKANIAQQYLEMVLDFGSESYGSLNLQREGEVRVLFFVLFFLLYCENDCKRL